MKHKQIEVKINRAIVTVDPTSRFSGDDYDDLTHELWNKLRFLYYYWEMVRDEI